MKIGIAGKGRLVRELFILVIFVTGFAVLPTGCATTIRTSVRRPAELDLADAETISVLPFRLEAAFDFPPDSAFERGRESVPERGRNADLREMSAYLTRAVSSRIAASEFFDLIAAPSGRDAPEFGLSAPCDIYLRGSFSEFVNEIETVRDKVSRKSDDGTSRTDVETYYNREVSLKVNYELIDAESSAVLGIFSRSVYGISGTRTTKDKGALPSAFSLVQRQLDTVADEIMRKIQPYRETVCLRLLSDRTKDPQMKEANALAKSGQLLAAEELFSELYAAKNYMEAGYNAALIAQAQGDLDGAKTLMSEIVRKFGAAKAQSALAGIEQEIKSRERLRQQMEQLESR